MQQAVEVAELALDGGGEVVVLVLLGGFQIEREDRRLRPAGGFDLVVDLFQVLDGLAQQDHRGAMGGEGARGGGTDATAGTGDQDHPILEQVGAGGILEHG
ncbi:hypothetical protein D3C81_1515830 [compost metagenome]